MQDDTKTTNVSPVTDADFATEVEGASGFVLVDFGAVWCEYCRRLEPHVKAVAEKTAGKLRVRTMDVDENHAMAMKYGIRGLPTLLLFHNGIPVGFSAFRPADALLAWLKEKGVEID